MKTGTKSLICYYYKITHTHTQHKWVKPNPSMTICLANRQRPKLFVEYNSTRRKTEITVSAESATRDRTGDGVDSKRRRTSNFSARRTPRDEAGKENGTGGAETSRGRRAMKRGNGTDKKETSSG